MKPGLKKFSALILDLQVVLGTIALVALPRAADAQAISQISAATGDLLNEPIVERPHEIRIAGHVLKYISRAGRLPIIDNQSGQIRAWIYFTAYVMEQTKSAPVRPLTFIWNGGPGGSSSLVHLVGFGPRRIAMPDNPPLGGADHQTIDIVDNPDTWLLSSDLVFVDPVGTGLSRAISRDVETEFFGTRADAESIAEFIRVYRNRFKTWEQPLIEGGESYGVTRAAWVAEALLRRKIPLAGVLLITWDIPLGDMSEVERHALSLPTFTAAAFYHKRLAPDLLANFDRTMAEVSRWSQGEYIDAVFHRNRLSDEERLAIAAKLARYTGLDVHLIDLKTLLIPTGFFSEQLLKDRQLAMGRYDSRFITSSIPPLPPSGHRIYLAVPDQDLVERYLRDELGVQTDLQYAGDTESYRLIPGQRRISIGEQWKDDTGGRGQPLETAFHLNPGLKVFEICGYYDLGANCIGDQFVIDKAGAEIARNITLRFYKGGHAPYFVDAVRPELQHDFSQFSRGLSR